jgi:predicted metal-dependent phosphoesterase TrpH
LIDLHCHTTASDGSLTPIQLVQLAKERGIAAIAIADHDTLDGLTEAVTAGEANNLCVIPAIELSVNSHWSSMHLLGYFSRPDPPNVANKINQIRSFRDRRNPIIAEKLNALGIPINFEDVIGVAGGQVIGRPHFAKVMVNMGVVSCPQMAFDKYLKKGAPAYVDRDRLNLQEAIQLIRADHGVPVLAHPGLIPLSNNNDIEDIVKSFVDMNGGGIEAYSPVHTKSFTNQMLNLANQFHLLVTGGTDFHGDIKPKLQLGIGEGDFLVPDELAKPLLDSLGIEPSKRYSVSWL